MRLLDLAHTRCGDKGNTASISVIAYDLADYSFLAEHLTAACVKRHLAGIAKGEVERFALPHLGALNFVLHDALAGGVTRSLNLDAHGKTLSSALLTIELPEKEKGP